MSNKDISKLTPEELMEVAKLPTKTDDLKDLDPVTRFIISDGLEQGDYTVPAILVYQRYVNWCKAYNLPVLSIPHFGKRFVLHFRRVRLPSGQGYVMSPKGFDLSPQNLAIANEPSKRISNGRKKKTRKEKI